MFANDFYDVDDVDTFHLLFCGVRVQILAVHNKSISSSNNCFMSYTSSFSANYCSAHLNHTFYLSHSVVTHVLFHVAGETHVVGG